MRTWLALRHAMQGKEDASFNSQNPLWNPSPMSFSTGSSHRHSPPNVPATQQMRNHLWSGDVNKDWKTDRVQSPHSRRHQRQVQHRNQQQLQYRNQQQLQHRNQQQVQHRNQQQVQHPTQQQVQQPLNLNAMTTEQLVAELNRRNVNVSQPRPRPSPLDMNALTPNIMGNTLSSPESNVSPDHRKNMSPITQKSGHMVIRDYAKIVYFTIHSNSPPAQPGVWNLKLMSTYGMCIFP